MIKLYANENFTKNRIVAGYTVNEFAKMIKVTPCAVRQYENRTNGVSPAVAKRVTELLKVDSGVIFDMIDNRGKRENVRL